MTTNKPYPVKKHELVFAAVKNLTSQTFKFTTNELLRDKKIVGLTAHLDSYITKTPTGDTLVLAAVGTNQCFLTLKTTRGKEELNKIPLYLLAAGVTVGGTYEKAFPIDNQVIDWEQSYITTAAANILVQDSVFMLSVWYIDNETTCDPAK